MEWLLLWLVLSAIGLEGIALFINEGSFYREGLKLRIEIVNDYGTIIGNIVWFLMIVVFTIILPITIYMLLEE